MREFNVYLVNAFTTSPFNGNTTGVVIGSESLETTTMQAIARDLNLSETVFIDRLDVGVYTTRFFTPTTEIDLCGHATIATFFALCQHQYILPIERGIKKVVQHTKCGKVYVDLEYDHFEIQNVYMHLQVAEEPLSVSEELIADALGLPIAAIGLDEDVLPTKIKTGLKDIVVPIKELHYLQTLNPNFEKIKQLTAIEDTVSLEVFAQISDKDIVQRTFSPSIGVNEEAGSATSTAATLYYLRHNAGYSVEELHSKQGSELARESNLKAYCTDEGSVMVGGKAFVFMDGVLHL
ncbi:PhzF family phenazine biosynthesis protein [Peptoniphilus equinus]|uniref:PhzF family phenazine biosynthesis protein n=1 Tax=Peptoniphilus equinus TaxID=3016343 RepID=A0ABY7QUW5_9FIRM|nr:PhzF family phenazine biosynthesis protein [Peptoniphilus equinus]WBW49973.1 PhzF family phenazine biosynthesis protein [Peptoniphilus equinus]